MKRYEKYKSCKIEWINEVPQEWNILKLGRSFSNIGSGTTPKSTNSDYYDDGTINWLNTGDLNDSYITETSKKITQLAVKDHSTLKEYPIDSIVIALYGATIGKLGHLKIKTTTNQACCVFSESDEIIQRFLFYYFLAAREFIISESYGGGQPNISQDLIRQLYIPTPAITEQTNIAAFLDHKTAQIDTLIEKKEQLIEKLKAQRQAIINEAVTKGLNSNAPMKDSGVEWLGEIPLHWTLKRLKHIKAKKPNAFVDGPFGSNLKSEHFVENGDVYVIESGFITSGKFDQHKNFKTITYDHFKTIERSSCQGGDIIIAKIGANYGTSGILPKLDKPAVVSGNSLKFSLDTAENVIEFLHYYLIFIKSSGTLDLIVNATAQPALSLGTLNEIEIPIPSKEEQSEIVTFLSNETSLIDTIIEKLVASIEKLTLYRQSIISEAVTGKIDVRDWKTTKTIEER